MSSAIGTTDIGSAIVALTVHVGPADDTETFVTAALEGLAIPPAVPGDATARATELLRRCLARIPGGGDRDPTVLLLGETPQPTDPPIRTRRVPALADALSDAAVELATVSAVVLLACDGDDGAAVALMSVADGTPALARLATPRPVGPDGPASADLVLATAPAARTADRTHAQSAWPVRNLSPAVRDLVLVAEAAICLHRLVLPARPRGSDANMLDATDQLATWPCPADGRRRCVVLFLAGSQVMTADLDEAPAPQPSARSRIADRPTVLLPVKARTTAGLADQLEMIAACASGDLRELGRQTFATWRRAGDAPVAAALVANSAEQLRSDAEFFVRLLSGGDLSREWRTPTGSVITAQPARGSVAFVYPGFASAYVNAGRRLGYYFPQVQNRLLATFGTQSYHCLHLDLISPRGAQASPGNGLDSDVRALSEATTALAVIYTAMAREVFALTPRQAFGYSIGESAMLFALGLWRDTETMARHLDASGVLNYRLVGEMRTVREYWARKAEPVAPTTPPWATVLARTPVAEIAAAAAGEPGCFVPLINTPDEAVLAGRPDAVHRAASTLPGRITPLEPPLPLHCAAMRAERDTFFDQHDLPTQPVDITLYSSARYAPIPPDRSSLAGAIADAYTRPVDFPRLVRQVYADGARVFVEMGPRRICSTWIDEILADRAHVTVPLDLRGVDGDVGLIRGLAQLVAHQVPLTLDALYEPPDGALATSAPGRAAQQSVRLADASVAEIADLIAAEVANLLCCPPELVNQDASLLELGIDSLAIVGLVDRAEREHAVRLELADLFDAGTIRGLAELIDARRLAMTLVRPPAVGDRQVLRI